MKRKVIIPLVVFLAILGIGAATKYRPHTVPWEECSEVYRQYATTDGVRASFLKNYPLNDTVTVDVTLLESTDTSGWQKLYNDFNLTLYKSGVDPNAIDSDNDAIEVFLQPDNDIVCASHLFRYITIFHTQDSIGREYILDATMKHTFESIKTTEKIIDNEKNI
jgi:hypothetical protein